MHIFNHSSSGESIRNSLGLLEYLAARGKAPRLALISFDHMELAMIANPAPLPFGAKWNFALKYLTFAAVAAWVCFGLNLEKIAENRLNSNTSTALRNVGFAVVMTLVLIFLDRSQTFIYFRF